MSETEFSISDLDLTESLSASMLLGISSIMIDSLRLSQPLDMHTACSLGCYDSVRDQLTATPTVVSAPNWSGWTPLHFASFMGHDTIVNLLLDHNADVSAKCNVGFTPLHYAASNGKESIVYFLLQHGANVNEHAKNGDTPLYSAAAAGEVSTLKVLIQCGANIESTNTDNGNTPLLAATEQGSESCVKALLDAGADTNKKNNMGQSCRDIALSQEHANMTIINLLNARVFPKDKPKRAEASLVDKPLFESPPSSPHSHHRLASPNVSRRASESNASNSSQDPFDQVYDFLKKLHLEKFFPLFKKQEVDFGVLKSMTETDLKDIGITLFGPRRKLAMAIEALNQKPVMIHPQPLRIHVASPSSSLSSQKLPTTPVLNSRSGTPTRTSPPNPLSSSLRGLQQKVNNAPPRIPKPIVPGKIITPIDQHRQQHPTPTLLLSNSLSNSRNNNNSSNNGTHYPTPHFSTQTSTLKPPPPTTSPAVFVNGPSSKSSPTSPSPVSSRSHAETRPHRSSSMKSTKASLKIVTGKRFNKKQR